METFAFFVWIMMATLQTTYCIISTSCVKTCVDQSNGNYQHCSDCHYYVACSNGYKYVMPCPSNLVWDDVKKRCEWTSTTCNATTPFRIILRPTRQGCVDSCVRQSDGNYQHCSDCHQYVACSNERNYIMPCPSNLVWDDVKKRCEWTSSTCNATAHKNNATSILNSTSECVESCVGRSDGNYQHCSDCHQYVACSNGYKYAMPCPSNLVWDDIKKRCEWTSSTCNESTTETNITQIYSDSDCVESCVRQHDGNYQHCSDCHQYVSCSNEYDYIMQCPGNLVWDDQKKTCEWTSNTCNEIFSEGCVNSCVGHRDGNYQHCSDCHRYVACSNGYDYIMPCPSNLVWDDIKKRCEWTSLTCNLTTHSTSTAKPFTQTSGCVETCVDRRDGNYQYCSDCHHYVACSNGYKYIMPCSSNLVWDDVKKTCERTSSTCF